MVPVGLAGVPPQVHLVAACADVMPPARANAPAPAQAKAPNIVRNLDEPAALSKCLRLVTICSLCGRLPDRRNASRYLRKCLLATVLPCPMACKQQSRR